jgi:hypothetical protein
MIKDPKLRSGMSSSMSSPMPRTSSRMANQGNERPVGDQPDDHE